MNGNHRGSRGGTSFARTRVIIMITRFTALLSLFERRRRPLPSRRFRRMRMFNLILLGGAILAPLIEDDSKVSESLGHTFVGGPW